MIYGDIGVSYVQRFVIYNRWGGLVFDANNFEPNERAFGWDGFSGGKLMNSGVYVYHASVVFADGEVRKYMGDFTLLR